YKIAILQNGKAGAFAPTSDSPIAPIAKRRNEDVRQSALRRFLAAVHVAIAKQAKAAPEPSIRILGQEPQVRFVVGLDDAQHRDQSDEHANRVRAARESETVDLVAVFVVPTNEAVEIEHVAFQTDAERSAEQCNRFEARRANAVVVIDELLRCVRIARRTDVDGLIEAPDVRLEEFRRAIPRPV